MIAVSILENFPFAESQGQMLNGISQGITVLQPHGLDCLILHFDVTANNLLSPGGQ
jgi:hypothetical protein